MGSQRLAATMVDSSIPYRPWKNKLLQMWKLACSVEQGIIVLLQSLPNNKKVEKFPLKNHLSQFQGFVLM